MEFILTLLCQLDPLLLYFLTLLGLGPRSYFPPRPVDPWLAVVLPVLSMSILVNALLKHLTMITYMSTMR